MRPIGSFEFPPEQARIKRRAVILEWGTVVYMISAVAVLYVTMGSSQAMRTAFFEDLINLVPAAAFLFASRVAIRKPDRNHPYGFHKIVSVGYLTAGMAILAMGAFLLLEAVLKFAEQERTTIGAMSIFGHVVWAGWPMLLAIAYTGLPPTLLGRIKLKMAPKINDKILFAEADMMKADWMAASATAIGVLGVGLGYWWADPAAAGLVSFSIIHDGFSNVRCAIDDIIERRPMKTDQSDFDPLPERLHRFLEGFEWVKAADVRLRETGHVYTGEAFVIPQDGVEDLVGRIESAAEEAKGIDWRLHDLTIMPVRDLPEPETPEDK